MSQHGHNKVIFDGQIFFVDKYIGQSHPQIYNPNKTLKAVCLGVSWLNSERIMRGAQKPFGQNVVWVNYIVC